MSTGRRDARYGLALAAAIGGAWLALHIGGIFFWRWRPATLPLAAMLILVQAWLSTGLFIVAHDCMHGSLVPGRRWINTAIGTACLGAYAGLSYPALFPNHHAHHAAPGTPDDPDFHAAAPRRALPWFVSFFRTYYSHGQIGRITLVAVAYLLLGASLANIVAFWAVPALIALAQLFLFGTYLPHRHDGRPFADAHNARSSALSPIVSLMTCFHFGAYHHEHHLHPETPWWRLPVESHQFTGRIVTASNSKIFSEPVFNYTRDFPFIWEEMAIPITYQSDRAKAEEIMLEAARANAVDPATLEEAVKDDLQRRFDVQPLDLIPKVFYRITDNWLELTVRFIVHTHLIRGVKDSMSRQIIGKMDEAGIGIASATYDIVGLPPIEVRTT